MPAARSLYLRRAVIGHLRADTGVTALVPAQRNYGSKVIAGTLAWPFTRFGQPDELPNGSSCWDGSDVAFTVHAFSKTEFDDECANINAAIVASLGNAVLNMAGDIKARVVWLGSQIIPDGDEAGAWHGINRFGARI